MLDPLTLDQLRVLVTVAETGSFSAAARRLQRVQSAVSQSVQALETTLRLPLFDRTTRTPRPTEAGRMMIEDARRVLASAEALRDRAKAIVGGLEPELTIAVDHFLPRGPGKQVLRELSKTYPDVSVNLLTETASAVERHLRDGIADIAIFPFEMAREADYDAEFLVDIEMVPVVASDHPLARQRGPLSREDLAPHTQLVLTDGNTGSYWSRGILGRKLWRFADLNTRLNFLLEGFGWCFMPVDLIRQPVTEGKLKRLNIARQGSFHLALHVVHRRGQQPGIAARWVIDHLRAALSACMAEGCPALEPSAA
ncbi:LysR family transcriptional regulator [Muricoccus radiodurans]|uniref:LysR family transcriptional regulator n=1 Tax=Muricoccus radiodurans TaxID=2231721 RepID=UPI003CF0684A